MLYDIADFSDALKKHPGRFAFLGGGGGNANQRASAGSIFLERTVPMTAAGQTLLSQLPPQLAQRVAVDNVKAIYRLPN